MKRRPNAAARKDNIMHYVTVRLCAVLCDVVKSGVEWGSLDDRFVNVCINYCCYTRGVHALYSQSHALVSEWRPGREIVEALGRTTCACGRRF